MFNVLKDVRVHVKYLTNLYSNVSKYWCCSLRYENLVWMVGNFPCYGFRKISTENEQRELILPLTLPKSIGTTACRVLGIQADEPKTSGRGAELITNRFSAGTASHVGFPCPRNRISWVWNNSDRQSRPPCVSIYTRTYTAERSQLTLQFIIQLVNGLVRNIGTICIISFGPCADTRWFQKVLSAIAGVQGVIE